MSLTSLECTKHEPRNPSGDGVVLTHGAGGSMDSPLLIAIAEGFAAAGLLVLRFNLAYRQLRPAGPPHPATAQKDRDSIRRAMDLLRPQVTGALYSAGQSYGGRQISILAAEEPGLASALALFSYPLHAPGKPEAPRTEHFPRLKIPTLFIHGPRDAFATTEELEAARQLIPVRTAIIEVPKAGHELLRGRFDMQPITEALRALAS